MPASSRPDVSADSTAQLENRSNTRTSVWSRPSDRCRGLAVEDQSQGWRLRHRRRRRALGRALECDLYAARECPARGGRPGRSTRSRSSGGRCGGTACLWLRRADLVAAPRPDSFRPGGRGRPPAPESASCPRSRLVLVWSSRRVAQYPDVLTFPRRSRPGPGGPARRRRAFKAVEKVVTGIAARHMSSGD